MENLDWKATPEYTDTRAEKEIKGPPEMKDALAKTEVAANKDLPNH